MMRRQGQGKKSLPPCPRSRACLVCFGDRLQVPGTDSWIAQYSAGSLCGSSQHPHAPSLVPLLMRQGGVRGSCKHVPRARVSTHRAAGSLMAQQSCRRGWSALGLTTHQTFSHKSAQARGSCLADKAKHHCQIARYDYSARLYCIHIRNIWVSVVIHIYTHFSNKAMATFPVHCIGSKSKKVTCLKLVEVNYANANQRQ